MMQEKFNLIESIALIDSISKDIHEFVSMKAKSINSSLNGFDRDYEVLTDWSIDPFESQMKIYVSIYISVENRQAFVDRLYAKDLDRSFDARALISKCDKTYEMYFVD